MVMSAIILQYFSQVDLMDGCRARRCKASSPLGRLLDEGGDTIMTGNYGLLLAYAFCFNNPLLETIYFGMNVVFFVMELRYVTSGELVMTVGDIGNVEFELIFTIMLAALGIFGNEGL